jgi:dihydroorotate dehydrogenase electron transfer subunit
MLSPGPLGAAPRSDPLLPRPMAVYRTVGEARDEIEVLYKVTGRGTGLLAAAAPGDRVGVVGPLGRGFAPPAPGEHGLLVGGGTGTASLLDQAAAVARAGRATVVLGARSEGDLLGTAEFRELDVDLQIATEDGSAGHHGLVTELLAQALAAEPGDREGAVVYACGPTPMMRAAAALAREHGARCAVSLENPMACGFGVCLGCAAPLAAGGVALVCRDGPVFDAEAVDWENLA